MPLSLSPPIQTDNGWEVDVPADNSCLFWASTCAYLLPIIADHDTFKARCLTLFGEQYTTDFDQIHRLFCAYNPFTEPHIFADPFLNSLVRETFRSRVIGYMAAHPAEFISFWTPENSRLEANFTDHLSRMYDAHAWGGDTEIKAISQLLACTIYLDSDLMPRQNFGHPSDVILIFRHVNVAGADSTAGNHYRFDIDRSLGELYQQPSTRISAASPLLYPLSAATDVTYFTAPMAEEEELGGKITDEKILLIQNDKIADIKNLFNLYRQLDGFLYRKSTASTPISARETGLLLTKIAEAFSTLKWNNESAQHIRNLYGKMNYKAKKKNTDYIDFGKISLLHTSPEQTIHHEVSEIFAQHSDIFLQELQILSKNILLVLHKEKKLLDENKKVQAHVITECQDILQKLSPAIAISEKLGPLNHLLPLLDIQYDRLFLGRLCQPTFLQPLVQLDREQDPVRWRYACARILTILGETAKNFSDSFKERYNYLPLPIFTKLRDQLAHVHHKYIAKNNEDTAALLLSICKDDLPNLQKELKTILSALPTVSEPQTALKTIQDYALPLVDILPSNVKNLITQPLPFDQLTHLTLDQKNLLRSARMHWINKQLQNQTMKAHQTVSQKAPFDKEITNEKKYRNTIETLSARAALTPKQNEALETAKKSLAFLESKKTLTPSSQSLPVHTPKKCIDDASIRIELQKLEEELQTLRSFPHYCELLDYFTHQPKIKIDEGEKREVTDKLNGRVMSLVKEIERLSHLQTATPRLERGYAIEHSIAVIGQLMRELQEDKNLITEVLKNNATIKQGFANTVFARNQKVMHDPYSNNTSYLSTVIFNDALPLFPDIQALHTVLQTKTPQEIARNAIFEIVKVYYHLGKAYLRLNLLDEAEKCFRNALAYTTPERFAKFHMQNTGWTIPENVFPHLVSQLGATYVVECNKVSITIEDPIWLDYRVQVLAELGYCHLRQTKYQAAIQHLEEALKIYGAYPLRNPIFFTKIQAQRYIAIIKDDKAQATLLLPQIHKLAKTDYESYVSTLIHVATEMRHSQRYTTGLEVLEKVDKDRITDPHLINHFLTTHAFLLASRVGQIEQRLTPLDAISNSSETRIQLFKTREAAIIALHATRQAFERSHTQLKFTRGHHIGIPYAMIIEQLQILLSNQAVEFLPIPSQVHIGYNIIHEALTMQKKFKYDASISYQTLGYLCKEMYKKTNDSKYITEGLDAFTENTQHIDMRLRANAYAGKAIILFLLSRIPEAINSAVESKFYYTQLAPDKKILRDQEEDAYLSTQLSQAAENYIPEYHKAFELCELVGDHHMANGKTNEALVCYKKCLLGLGYLRDAEWEARIQGKLLLEAMPLSVSSSAAAAASPDFVVPPLSGPTLSMTRLPI